MLLGYIMFGSVMIISLVFILIGLEAADSKGPMSRFYLFPMGFVLLNVLVFSTAFFVGDIKKENIGKGNVGVAVVMMLTSEDAEFLGVEEDSGLLLVKTESSVYKVAIDQEDVNKVEYVLHGDEVIYERGENKIE